MTTQENTATTTVNNAVQAEAPVQAAVPQEQATMNYADPRTQAVNRTFDGIESFCKNNPKTANRIGATLLTGVGLGATVGGVIWFRSTF